MQRRWLPWTLGLLFAAAVLAPALDPGEQLYYRDTARLYYPYKQFIASQLRAFASPFWDPWCESGLSILGQVAPGLFHPLTLLYLLLPFELAFKLNHLAAIPLAFAGTYLLARKAGASAWGAAAGASAYAASGYLISAAGSNLPYALGAATVPLAVHGLLHFAQRPRPLRLLWAGFALALSFLGGDPQSMLFAGVIGAAWLVGGALLRRTGVARALGLTAAWSACALLLAAPAIGPALARARGGRGQGLTSYARESFANAPVRLLGLLLPWAFDDTQESATVKTQPHYTEYFAGLQDDAFADSIALGAPLLLLALASGRRGRAALLGALVLAAGSTGGSSRVLSLLELAIPGLKMFRYAEKLIAPASLLLCLAAGLGVTRLEQREGRWWRVAAATGAVFGAGWIALQAGHGGFIQWLQQHGKTHGLAQAQAFAQALQSALFFEGCLVLLLAALLFLHLRRPALPLGAALWMLCAAGAGLQTGGKLHTIPLEALHAPLLLAEELKGAAGPGAGRWRMRGDSEHVPIFNQLDLRLGRLQAAAQALNPQFNALASVETVSEYDSLADGDYHAALFEAPGAANAILGVRFDVQVSAAMTAAQAEREGYQGAAFGAWVKTFPARPRAFLAGCARTLPKLREAVQWMASPRFRFEEAAVRKDLDLACPAAVQGEVSLARTAADRMTARVDSSGAGLLIVAEHYDEGWRATVDGAPAEVVQADLLALGVRVPAGKHEVSLWFVPSLLPLGLWLCGACVLGLLLLAKRYG